MEQLEALLEEAVGLAWNYPVVALCLGAGLWFTLRFALIQIRWFGHAIKIVRGAYDKEGETGHITHLQALSAAVSGTVGLGNIAGVAIAVAMGGPGAVFWMWMIGFLGMATKFAECGLGTAYRVKLPDGSVRGAPMYYMVKGLGKRWAPLAGFFAFSTMIASFGGGNMFQSNQAASVMNVYFDIPQWVTGLVLASLVAVVIIGGIRRIGQVAGILVPFMCTAYVLGALFIVFTNLADIPGVFGVIFSDAFTGTAAAGGAIGTVIIWGVRRAVFSSEAGLGSAPMAHAAAKTDVPIRQGIVASLEPFIDTIVVCTMTAIVIILSGLYGDQRILELELREEPNPITRSMPLQEPFAGNGYMLVQVSQEPYRVEEIGTWEGFDENRRLPPSHLRFAGAVSPREGSAQFRVRVSRSSVVNDVEVWDVVAEEVYPIEAVRDPEVSLPRFETMMFELPTAPRRGDRITVYLEHMSPDTIIFIWDEPIADLVREPAGIELTTAAFDMFIRGFGNYFVSIAVFLFAFSTAITWSYYGETTAAYMLGTRAIYPFKWLFVIFLFTGAIWGLAPVLNFSDLMMALMAVPNIIAILLLTPKLRDMIKNYARGLSSGDFEAAKSDTEGS